MPMVKGIRKGMKFQYHGRVITIQYYSKVVGAYGCFDASDPDWYDYFTGEQLKKLPKAN